MRRVNVRKGAKQRINEILGTDQGTLGETSFPGITDWSVQAAMLENIRRVIKGIVGSAVGRPASGLWATIGGANTVKINKGVGFTSNGNAVIVDADFNYSIINTSTTVYLYLKHEMAEYKEDEHDGGGKNTEFIGKDNSLLEEIVYDDKGAAMGSGISESGNGSSLVHESTTLLGQSQGPDYIYLCKVEPGTVITNTYERCFESDSTVFPGDGERNFTVPGIVVDKDAFINRNLDVLKDLKVDEGGRLLAGGFPGLSETINISGLTSITVKKGIIIGKV